MGSQALDDGSCQPAGVGAEACGPGFQYDGAHGCEPVLPPEPCAQGEMAVPGEASCREIASCGDGSWGDIPVEVDTQHVDPSYAGGASDGSPSQPWTTIQQGIDAAPSGAIVAVAAGTYAEDVSLASKPVRLWGRCPAMVEVAGAGVEFSSLFVGAGASGAEIHQLAITGSGAGLAMSDASAVLFDRLWIHSTGHLALDVEGFFGETSAVLQHSLIESSLALGVLLVGAELTVESSVIRAIRQPSTGPFAGQFGFGVAVEDDSQMGRDASFTMRGSVLEDTVGAGVFVMGATAILEATVVRGTLPDGDGELGRGIVIEANDLSDKIAHAALDQAVIADNHELGVFVGGGSLSLDATVVRGTQPDGQGYFGRGVNIQPAAFGAEPTTATISSSLLSDNRDVGLFVSGAEVQADGVLVRGTLPDVDGAFGRGINARAHPGSNLPAVVQLRSSVVAGNHDVGIFVGGSELELERSSVQESLARPDAAFGDGIAVISDPEAPGWVHVADSSVDAAARAGLSNFGSTVVLERTHVVCCPIALNGESDYLHLGAPLSLPFLFDDQGDNLCGCAEERESCTVLSSGLTPPDPVP